MPIPEDHPEHEFYDRAHAKEEQVKAVFGPKPGFPVPFAKYPKMVTITDAEGTHEYVTVYSKEQEDAVRSPKEEPPAEPVNEEPAK